MLVLSRKPGEKIVLNNNITVTVLEVLGNRVKVGIAAPANVRVLRGELAFWLDRDNAAAGEPVPLEVR
jgi:carbon storage regulator